MSGWEVLALAAAGAVAVFVVLPTAVELVTRAAVRGYYEERAACVKRRYGEIGDNDGE